MLLDLKFSIGTLGISAGMFIAALYGMNLENFIEETAFGFAGVSIASTILAVAACIYGLRKLRRVQRLSMWGEGSLNKARDRSRGSWREIDSPAIGGDAVDLPLAEAVAGIKRADKMKLWKHAQNERLKAMADEARAKHGSMK
jgi:magnesium transporter